MSDSPAGSVHHIAVATTDLDASRSFYEEVLGFPRLSTHRRRDGSVRSLWLAIDAHSFLALEEVPGGSTRSDQAPGVHCLCFAIDLTTREHWRERLVAAGFPIERESPHTLYVRSPEGALVGLSHYPDAAIKERIQ
ncbi:MAG: VOC family protein [Myxococcota bacterium]